MLISLHVKNLALIAEEEVYFTEGLNILTGETGAGKSIIIGSVNMALGAKADKEYIRSGAEYALIELVFQLKDKKKIAMVEAMDLSLEEDGLLIIQRKIMPARSICKVNGETVSAGQLKNLASFLLDIHGQHEHQSLLKSANHKEILDLFIVDKLQKTKEVLKVAYQSYTAIQGQLAGEETDAASRQREADLLQFEVREITEAALQPGEDEQVEGDYRRMQSAGRIREAVALAYSLTGDGRGNTAGEEVSRALREIRGISALDEGLAALEEQLQDIDNLLNDFNRSAAEYLTDLEFDEQTFIDTENRLNQINHLKNKYGASIQNIFQYKAAKEQRLAILVDFEAHKQQQLARQAALKEEILAYCGQISQLRKKSGSILAEKMRKALIDLNFIDVRFEISVIPHPENFGADGYDKIEFLISTNPGEALKPLQQIASGGELSRIMLALKTVQADKNDIHTLIFDEVDAGISGKTAWKVSEKLAFLGRGHQVICITHLPQIAAMADSHFLILKKAEHDRTTTSISRIKDEDSVHELARLLGSDTITDAVINNAKEMKELAAKTKNF